MARLTLHEAMVVVLKRHGGSWLDRDVIAEVIARKSLYLRPSDGQPPPSDQLRLRARKYPDIFECSDTSCSRIRLRERADSSNVAAGADHTTEPPSAGAGLDDSARLRDGAARKYKPDSIRLLLVAEAPPRALDRYFYFDDVRTQDSLFRYVARSILEREPTRANKPELLGRLCDEGVFLVDLEENPHDPRPLPSHVPDLVARIELLQPQAIIIIKATVFDAAFESLNEHGFPVFDERIPFPGSGRQKQFERRMSKALEKAGFR